jgi:hypothetical protein
MNLYHSLTAPLVWQPHIVDSALIAWSADDEHELTSTEAGQQGRASAAQLRRQVSIQQLRDTLRRVSLGEVR